jgi:hypothetical protein
MRMGMRVDTGLCIGISYQYKEVRVASRHSG